jgi:murein DD-endopeptidase MepM/ murein hydrolase activator NlpD
MNLPSKPVLREEHHLPAAILLFVGILAFVIVPGWAAVVGRDDDASRPMREVRLELPALAAPSSGNPVGGPPEWTSLTVASGQTLGRIFAEHGLSASLMHRMLAESPRGAALTRLRAGQQLELLRAADGGALEAIRFDATETERVTIRLDGARVVTETSERPIERRVRVGSGTVESSLFAAGDAAGISDATVIQMAKVLGYDIDFARDIRRGDRFSVVYEELYQDGERLRGGDILAVTFVNAGKRHVAVRHRDASGNVEYYTADGRPLRKAFLRTPVEFSRISSRFSMGRMHPILGRMRAHRGVDYAAPTGTPIMASGNGVVTFRGWQGGYGNTIIIDHGNRKTTLYAHLSRFANGVQRGQRVRQGQVIGFVGATGLATGPHLHYEFRINGVHRDPLTVVLPPAEPLTGKALADFRAATAPLVAKLDLLEDHGRLVAAR